MGRYLDEAAVRRGQDPRDDVLSALVAAERSGEMTTGNEQASAYCCSSPVSTAAGLISTSLYLLAHRPEQRATLLNDPSSIPAGVEELTRFVSPVQALARTATCDLELYDSRISAGERILLVFGAANRDPRRFPTPDELDVTRAIDRHRG